MLLLMEPSWSSHYVRDGGQKMERTPLQKESPHHNTAELLLNDDGVV